MPPTTDTGIGILVYDRPEHTQAVLEGFSRNDIEQLYVFADGPATEKKVPQVEATRDVVREADFCDIELIAREENLGVEESFIKAYDYIFSRHEKGVLFEDDCVPSGDCIQYMRNCLDRYEAEERVMNVHAYGPPIDIPEDYEFDVYFTWRSGSWGQATWRSAWKKYDRDPKLLDKIQTDTDFRKKVERAGRDLIPMLRQEVEGEIDSGAVWWSFTLIRHEGVSINPVTSKVKNIGIDGTGVHSGTSSHFDVEIDRRADTDEFSFPPSVTVNKKLNRRYNRFIGEGLRGRVRRWVKERFRNLFR